MGDAHGRVRILHASPLPLAPEQHQQGHRHVGLARVFSQELEHDALVDFGRTRIPVNRTFSVGIHPRSCVAFVVRIRRSVPPLPSALRRHEIALGRLSFLIEKSNFLKTGIIYN